MNHIAVKYRILKKLALVVAFTIIFQAISPLTVQALTSGPNQPEFSSFEPVVTTSMVNEFSGDFTYNLPVLKIPGANGGGYAMSLSYHSGASPEEEASWVGYGWSLNPGAINRGKRGFPDDYDGQKVKYWNKTPDNWTVSLGGGISGEFYSAGLPVGINASLRYNNYKGFGYTAGIGITVAGMTSLGFSVSDGQSSFSASVNPAAILSKQKDENKSDEEKIAEYKNKKYGASFKQKAANKISSSLSNISLTGSSYGIFSMNESVRATHITQYSGKAAHLTVGLIPTASIIPAGPSGDLVGSYSIQSNVELDEADTYGYMYSGNATEATDMMDYYTEKESNFDKRDYYLGLPFSNADNFSVTGEGLSGGFRMHNRKAGHFRPNEVTSTTNIVNVGLEAELGFNIGSGTDLGTGFQTLEMKEWYDGSNMKFANSGDEPYFFRFNNDLGGSVEFGNSDAAQQADLSGINLVVDGIIEKDMNNGARSGRSSYIAYHTNEEIAQESNGKKYNAYTHRTDIDDLINRDETSIEKGIGEVAIINEGGMQYTYGLPVYSRNEYNLQYSVRGVSGNNVDNNYLVYKDVSNSKTKVGEERAAPYAASYLLTSIVTPDYVDRTLDGPTKDDFGGWTRFNYTRIHGPDTGNGNKAGTPSNDWYQWRMPYAGMYYNRNTLSDSKDDMGSVIGGEKEVYYLSEIETKTHKAIFHTVARNDGKGAALITNEDYSNENAAGTNALQRLEKIVLYAKHPDGSIANKIKTVHFDYDYHLADGVPNSSEGKLTLKKVWFEHEGVVNAKISPYIFKYKYKTEQEYRNILPYDLKTKYSNITSFANGLGSEDQNPNYDPLDIDAWGNYQQDGAQRYDSMNSFVNQNPASTFDPAAWQLKQIRLPSGGEIHVQYEQDDYRYVQDQEAMAMVTLKPQTDIDESDNKYYIDEAKLGIVQEGSWEQNKCLQKLKAKINNTYAEGGERMYFKFLYSLLGGGVPDLSTCNAEYVTGYVRVLNADIDNDGLYIQLGSEEPGDKFELPKQVCKNLVNTQLLGKISSNGNCNADVAGVKNNGSAKDVVMSFVSFLNGFNPNVDKCKYINPEYSYLKIPMCKDKKGGGIRVKRLVMVDKGVEPGDGAMYGSEYIYKTLNKDGDEISSGVATFEPSSIREENPLVKYEPKGSQSAINKIISGIDREQNEGPRGESVFPAASVGYSKVIVKNIHDGKTNTGLTVNEFRTAQSDPVIVKNTAIKKEKINPPPLTAGVFNLVVNQQYLTQGYAITLNSMHGQPSSIATYGGDYGDILNPEKNQLSTKQEFEYFDYRKGEKVPMMYDIASGTVLKNPGKEMEVVLASKKVLDNTKDFNVEGDVSFAPPFFPQGSALPSATIINNSVATHVATKVIRYPAIQKSVITYQDGIYHTSNHTAFNPHTGQPMVTETTDGYNFTNHDGTYTSYSFPASLQYKEMGQKSNNEGLINNNPNATFDYNGGNPEITFNNSNACETDYKTGDLIKINAGADYFYHIVEITGNKLVLSPSNHFKSDLTSSATINSIFIVKSGLDNMLNANVGNVTTYGESTVESSSVNLGNGDISGMVGTLNNEIKDMLSNSDTYREVDVSSFNVKAEDGCSNCEQLMSVDISLTPTAPQTCQYSTTTDRIVIDFNTHLISSICSIEFDKNDYSNTPARNASHCSGTVVNGGGGNNGGISYLSNNPDFCENNLGLRLSYYNNNIQLNLLECDESTLATIPSSCSFTCGGENTEITQVIAASAQTYEHDWTPTFGLAQVYAMNLDGNPFEQGFKGQWRQKDNYVYESTITGGAKSNERVYDNAGVFDSFTLFNWKNEELNDLNHWIKLNTITAYSPNGNALEEENILGIKSTAKFGYEHTLPYLVAQNAAYKHVLFESFENNTNNIVEDYYILNTGTITNITSHSGQKSLQISNNDELELKYSIVNNPQTQPDFDVKVWVKEHGTNFNENPIQLRVFRAGGADFYQDFDLVAEVGEWRLFEVTPDKSQIDAADHGLYIKNNSGGTIYIDDLRFQPVDAQMICYVYDVDTRRLLTSFDDQHFGLYYQYNAEGNLIRKQIETERGLKTIQQTQYHTPLISRTAN